MTRLRPEKSNPGDQLLFIPLAIHTTGVALGDMPLVGGAAELFDRAAANITPDGVVPEKEAFDPADSPMAIAQGRVQVLFERSVFGEPAHRGREHRRGRPRGDCAQADQMVRGLVEVRYDARRRPPTREQHDARDAGA